MIHCLFEQSGTFKNEFKKLGFDAIDYDISDSYGQTDVQIDLFAEIEKAYDGAPSIFDDVNRDDLVLAFFPCIRFQATIPLAFRGEQRQQVDWPMEKKLAYAMKLHEELHRNYMVISKLVLICMRGGLRLMIENPNSQPHYLTQFWPLKPTLIDPDRTMRGDYMKKATQYWFINFQPANNLIFEAVPIWQRKKVMDINSTIDGRSREEQRSEIAPEYANRFIREFLIEKDAPQPDKPDASNGNMDDSMPTLF